MDIELYNETMKVVHKEFGTDLVIYPSHYLYQITHLMTLKHFFV
jgi:hypothetical protein